MTGDVDVTTDSAAPLQRAVTGVLGFVGSAVADALLRRGTPVLGLDRADGRGGPGADRLRRLQRHPGFTFRRVDLAADPLAPLLGDVSTVYHLAGATGLHRPQAEYARDNPGATRALVRAAEESGVRLVHASTSSVYGLRAMGSEDGSLRPVSAYGESKLAAERAVLAGVDRGLDAVVLRLFSVYGPDQRRDMAYSRIIEAAIDGTGFTVYGDGHQSRSNTYVRDAVEAFLRSGAAPAGTVLNVCGDAVVSLRDVIDEVGRLTGRRPEVVHAARRPGDQHCTAGVAGRARELIGWAPSTPFREGLAAQVAWALRARAWSDGGPVSPGLDGGLRIGSSAAAPSPATRRC